MKQILFTLLLSIFATFSFGQAYEIKVKIKNLPNQELILGHHFNDKLIPDDTVRTDNKGVAIFKGKDKLIGGMYFIFLPSKSYFDILVDKDQKFTIENDTTDFLDNIKIQGSEQNDYFVEYQKMLRDGNVKAKKLNEEKQQAQKAGNTKRVKEIDEEYKKISQKFEDYYNMLQKKNPEMFFAKFLKGTKEIEIPKTITNRNEQYYYYKAHYWDNFDLSDPRLLNSPLYKSKVDRYIDKIVIQHPDTLIKETGMLIEKSRTSPELFRFMLIHLFNKYAKSEAMTAENVYVTLADIYVKDAVWDTDSFKTELKKKVARKKNCLIGNIAKDLKLKQLSNDSNEIEKIKPFLKNLKEAGLKIEKDKPDFSDRKNDLAKILSSFMKNFKTEIKLSDVEAKYTIIWFWEPDCSHCRKATPVFHKFYQDTLKAYNVEVISVYMNKGIDNWKEFSNHIGKFFDFVEKHQLYDWINAWNPFDPYRENYDIKSSPVLYLLDENKEILAKRIDYRQAYDIIQSLEKNKK